MKRSVPEDKKRKIFRIITSPKKIADIASEINLSKKRTGNYLKILCKNGDVQRIPDFNDMRSFYYVINDRKKPSYRTS